MIARRLSAHLIDLLICSMPLWFIGLFISSNPLILGVLGLLFGIMLFGISPVYLKFRTPGMIVFKLEMVAMTISRPSIVQLVTRYLLLYSFFFLLSISLYFRLEDVSKVVRSLDAAFFLVGVFPLFRGKYLTLWDQVTNVTVNRTDELEKIFPTKYYSYPKFLIF